MYNLRDLIKLYSLSGIGPARIRNLIAAFGSPQAVLDAPVQHLVRVQGVEKHTAGTIKEKIDEKYVSYQMECLEKEEFNVITYWDEEYPPRLKKIYDAPVLLFYKGDPEVFKTDKLGVVGMRNPSAYGKMVTEKFCRELVGYNLTIVSGLARGVDTFAHRIAIEHSGKTIAVLGSGLDNIYPPENHNLAQKIVENGAIVTEYLFGTIPESSNFPRRNRIISGLSLGVLICEAGIKSGALITAYQALDQNREVFSIPGPVNSPKSAGTNQLIRQGAVLVRDTSDILEELESQLGEVEIIDEPVIRIPEGFEQTVYAMLSDEPVHVDYLSRKSQHPTAKVLSALLTLELLGAVKQLSGKMFVRVNS